MDTIKKQIYNILNIDENTINRWKTTNYSIDNKVSLKLLGYIEKVDIVIILGDYDVDGISGTHIYEKGIQSIYPNKEIKTLIPTRSEGYGLNERIVKDCKEEINKGKKVLVLTVDTGITAKTFLEELKQEGCYVFLTDHHKLEDKTLLPKVDYIINPNVTFIDNPLIGRNWCGAAIAYKIMENIVSPQIRQYLLVFAGIATISDVIEMREGSWQLVREALEILRINPPYNLALLLGNKNLNRDMLHLSEDDISYYLAPAFNAPGRLEVKGINPENSGAKIVLNYLNNPTERVASYIKTLNDKRKEIRDEELEKVKNVIKIENKENNNPIWVYVPGLHTGLLGLIAGNLVNEYKTSVCLCTNDDNIYRGSSRSYEDFNMYKYLTNHKDLLIKYGGHEKADGFQLTATQFKKIEKQIEKKSIIKKEDNSIKIKLDDIPHINNIMTPLRPFGEGYIEPIYKTEINLKELNYSMIGSDKNHLSIKNDVPKWKALHFRHTDNNLNNKTKFNAYGKIHSSYYKQYMSPELIIQKVTDEEEETEHNNDLSKD